MPIPNTIKKAKIKRASKQAQANANDLDEIALAELTELYQRTKNEIEQQIRTAGAGTTITVEKLGRLKKNLQSSLSALAETQQTALDGHMRAGAQYGSEPFKDFIDADTLSKTVDRSVLTARTFTGSDGLQLSDRLWRINDGANEAIIKQVERSVMTGQSASQAAAEFMSSGQPVPKAVLNNINLANGDALASAAGRDFMTGEGNAYGNALRVFRTEINRAHILAYRNAAFEDDSIIGTKFLLSSNHRVKDICDMHARANVYGLGPGVYPRDKSPLPAHPNTLSYETVVFDDDITQEDKDGKETRIDWLIQQPDDVQVSVLRSEKKRQALVSGHLTESQIRTPWRVLEPRYKRQGIDTEFQNAAPYSPNQISNTVTGTAKGVPVSSALTVNAHQQVSKTTIDAINSVHGDGILEKIPVSSYQGENTLGEYISYTNSGVPVGIQISTHGNNKEFTLAHEIGHFIDHRGIIKNGQFASADSAEFEGWRNAIAASEAIKTLVDMAYHKGTVKGTDKKHYNLDRKYIRYLLQTKEIFARAYSQYIAIRSGDETLLNQLRYFQRKDEEALVYYPEQWRDDDFNPIADAIDALFIKLGWMNEP